MSAPHDAWPPNGQRFIDIYARLDAKMRSQMIVFTKTWYRCEMGKSSTSFALHADDRAFMDRKIAEGRFDSRSEVVRTAMRLLKDEELRVEQLRAAVMEGLASGPAEAFDVEQFLRSRRNS